MTVQIQLIAHFSQVKPKIAVHQLFYILSTKCCFVSFMNHVLSFFITTGMLYENYDFAKAIICLFIDNDLWVIKTIQKCHSAK
jgi:hypothetical protein